MTTLAVYVFESHAQAQDALERLYSSISSGGFSKVGDEIRLESSCQDLDLASRILRSCGGSRR